MPPRFWEPLVTYAYLASITKTLRFGTGILVLPMRRDIVATAKQICTLDHFSGGRVELGVGIGVGADTMSWGSMINDARTELTRDPVIWWKLTTAFAFMIGLVLPANIFADAVRDALDPRLRTQ